MPLHLYEYALHDLPILLDKMSDVQVVDAGLTTVFIGNMDNQSTVLVETTYGTLQMIKNLTAHE